MTFSPTRRALAAPVLALAALACSGAMATELRDSNITEPEVLAAQKAWGEGLVAIGRAFEAGGPDAAKATASAVIDKAYGYALGPVLFKPTLTRDPQTFRTTKAGALAYFVGQDPQYPNDSGFALRPWRSVEIRNVGVQINGAVANTMGKVLIRAKDGTVTTVDKTWSFRKDEAGVVRIILHHSSLPYTADETPAPTTGQP